jgi:hypothetical protein
MFLSLSHNNSQTTTTNNNNNQHQQQQIPTTTNTNNDDDDNNELQSMNENTDLTNYIHCHILLLLFGMNRLDD